MRTSNVLFWSVTVALGGFLFGFDTAVISGAEQAIQQLWGLSDAMIGQVVAMALYGTIIGAIFGGIPADRYGRRTTLFWIGLLYLGSAIGSAIAPDAVTLMLARFIGGLGVGASSVVAPMYISEIAPASDRGRLVATFQFNIVLGILIAYFSNYLIGGGSWRLMLGVEIVPAIAFVLMVLRVPRSPRWLLVKLGNEEEARQVLAKINPSDVQARIAAIKNAIVRQGGANNQPSLATFFGGAYNWPILLAFLFAFFNQVSGINAVIYYAPRIFAEAGLEASSSLLASVGIGVINLLFTILGMLLIDRYGRRTLMYVGSVGYILSLGVCAYSFAAELQGLIVPISLFVFIASHAIGQGAVIWVFISEIFPNEVRSFGTSLGSSTHWIFAAIIAGTFPWLASLLGPATLFGIFAAMMVFQLLFVAFMMPETKGVALEDMQISVPSSAPAAVVAERD